MDVARSTEAAVETPSSDDRGDSALSRGETAALSRGDAAALSRGEAVALPSGVVLGLTEVRELGR